MITSSVSARTTDPLPTIVRLPRCPEAVEAPVPGEEPETSKEKTDRQLVELLNELRVALPGTQFLFAFLLAVPFAARFTTVRQEIRVVFYVCLLATLVATILLMAPAVYHRVRWQQGDKADVIRVAHRMFLAGMASLGIAMASAVWVVSDILLGTLAAVVATCTGVVLLVVTWFALPLRRVASDAGE